MKSGLAQIAASAIRAALTRAIRARFHQFGGPEVLQYEDVAEPQLRKDQVLIRVKACALNHLDLFIRKGLPGIKLPHINGSDIAGEIAELGEYVTDLAVGQRVLLAPMTFCGHCVECVSGRQNFCPNFSVLGYANDGGDCEYIAVPRVSIVPVPEGVQLTFEKAASASTRAGSRSRRSQAWPRRLSPRVLVAR